MRKALVIFCAVLMSFGAEAQFNQDYGVIVGVATHKGDINSSKQVVGGSAASPTIGGYYRYKFNSLFSARGQIQWARISGHDKNADAPERIARNLGFRTDLIEFAAIAEVHFIDLKDFGSTGRYNTFFNAYGFLGVAMTYFNPMGQRDNGEWVNLRPLQTEGQSYGTFTPAFPLGVGAHMTFNRKWRLGVEFGYRFTMTDYLDDVHDKYLTRTEYESGDPLTYEMAVRLNEEYILSRPDIWPYESAEDLQNDELGGVRGGPDVNDAYYFATVNVGFMIRGKSNFYRARYQFTRGRKHKKRRARAKF